MAVVNIGTFFQIKKSVSPILRYSYDNSITKVDITLTNVVSGSRYWVYDSSDMSLLGSGTASGTTVTISNIEWFSDKTILIRVRKSSSGTKYLPFDTQATLTNTGANVFISQVEDPIAV